jgi:hypothetical protein
VDYWCRGVGVGMDMIHSKDFEDTRVLRMGKIHVHEIF